MHNKIESALLAIVSLAIIANIIILGANDVLWGWIDVAVLALGGYGFCQIASAPKSRKKNLLQWGYGISVVGMAVMMQSFIDNGTDAYMALDNDVAWVVLDAIIVISFITRALEIRK